MAFIHTIKISHLWVFNVCFVFEIFHTDEDQDLGSEDDESTSYDTRADFLEIMFKITKGDNFESLGIEISHSANGKQLILWNVPDGSLGDRFGKKKQSLII